MIFSTPKNRVYHVKLGSDCFECSIFYFSIKDMRLLLGAHDVTLEEERRRMECKVMRLQPHPGYDGSTKHDIMLVQHKCSTVRLYI